MDDKTQAAPPIADRVRAGAAWLDQHRPGWARGIDLITLDVRDPEHCVLGQTYDDFTLRPRGLRDLAVARDLGFYVDWYAGRDTEYAALTNAWREVIEGRILPAATPCCPCQRAVCEPGCTCPSPDCPKTLAEVLDD